MKRTARLPLLFCLAAIFPIVAACGASGATTPVAAANKGTNVVVAIQGGASVKRQGWSEYAPALFGMVVNSSDLLRLDTASQATIACADLTVAKAAGGVSNVPCKVSKPLLSYDGSAIVPPRPATPLDIPLVIAPRKTKLMAGRITLRWSAVPGATTYKVSLRGPNLAWTMDVAGKTEIEYPDTAPLLAPGAAYKLTVVAGSRSSDEEGVAGLGFTMLKPEESQVVRDGEARIRSLALSDAATRLLIANLYGSQGLIAEAIEQLESLSATAKEPAVTRLLGSLYLGLGLSRLAEDRYTQSLGLSQAATDIEGQASAESALGVVYEALGNKEEAILHSQKAIAWYQKLGDTQTIKAIQDRLAGLQRP